MDSFVFWLSGGDEERQIRLFAEDVVPALRAHIAAAMLCEAWILPTPPRMLFRHAIMRGTRQTIRYGLHRGTGARLRMCGIRAFV